MKISFPALLLFIQLVVAADLPEPVIPEASGVNIHFITDHEKDLDMIADAGFKFIRMDFSWHATEAKKGQYDWSAYDGLVKNLKARAIRPLFILDYSNPLYEESLPSKNPVTHQDQLETASPRHPASIEAFARWAAAAATHFRDHRVIWEIWNEPNIFFWKPKPDVTEYIALATTTAAAIRKAEPNATIIGPAISTFPWDFLEQFCASGILKDIDAVSVHPYRAKNKPPETAAADFNKLRDLIAKHAPPGHKLPIISGEWGYSSWSRNVSPETQAAFLVRQQISNLLNDIPLSIWYDWKNDGEDPNENEHNFGTVSHDLQPKPAYTAFRTFTSELRGYRIEKRLLTEKTEDYIVLFKNNSGSQRLACWTSAARHNLSIDLPQGKNTRIQKSISLDRKSANAAFENGKLAVTLAEMPILIFLN